MWHNGNNLQETPIYFFLFFLFFTSLVDDALIIEYFMSVFGHQLHTTTVCQFLTFTSIGNRLLQVRVLIQNSWTKMGLFFNCSGQALWQCLTHPYPQTSKSILLTSSLIWPSNQMIATSFQMCFSIKKMSIITYFPI